MFDAILFTSIKNKIKYAQHHLIPVGKALFVQHTESCKSLAVYLQIRKRKNVICEANTSRQG